MLRIISKRLDVGSLLTALAAKWKGESPFLNIATVRTFKKIHDVELTLSTRTTIDPSAAKIEDLQEQIE